MKVFGKERDYIIHNNDFIKGFFGEFRWLSNYHLCEIKFEGHTFPSTENAYVFAKIDPTTITDGSVMSKIVEKLLICSPNESKKIGRSIPLRENWNNIKYDIMSSIVFDKFYRHKELRYMLLNTGYKYIEETNHWKDTYWGVCDGIGDNKLGKIHMAIRDYWAIEYPDLLHKSESDIF